MKNTLKKIYETHGALTFMLAFYPMIPSVLEFHVKSILSLSRRLTGTVHGSDEIIKHLFGSRGVKVYEDYKKKHPKQILPNDIFEAFFEVKDPENGLKLAQKMFFDKHQRGFEHSDKLRASIILATPEILREYPDEKNAETRSHFIRILSNQAVIDKAIPSQLAFIEVALRLLTQIERHRLQIEKERLEVMFQLIEAKIKAELAGKSSAFTAPIKTVSNIPKDPIILTPEDAQNIHQVLLLLAISPAIEVRDEAKEAILEINRLKKARA